MRLFPSSLRGKHLQALAAPPSPLLTPSLLSLRAGPLAAPAAAPSATVPARANFLTARASTASALRSSSDEDPGSLPFGEWPAPRVLRVPFSPRGLRTSFSRPLGLQMACPAHWPGNQPQRTQGPLGQWDCRPLEDQKREGLRLWQAPCPLPSSQPSELSTFEGEGGAPCPPRTALREDLGPGTAAIPLSLAAWLCWRVSTCLFSCSAMHSRDSQEPPPSKPRGQRPEERLRQGAYRR